MTWSSAGCAAHRGSPGEGAAVLGWLVTAPSPSRALRGGLCDQNLPERLHGRALSRLLRGDAA